MNSEEITRLKEYCDTDTQTKVFDLLGEGNSAQDIADIMEYASSNAVRNIIYRVKRYAAVEKGYAPEAKLDDGIDGFAIKGMSDYKNMENGELSRRWIKYDANKVEQTKMFTEYIEEKSNKILALPEIKINEKVTCTAGLTVYPVADAHVGVYTSEEETGVKTNLEIQMENYRDIITKIVTKADPTKVALISLLGDFFHANDATNATPAHKHTLDVSARQHEIIDEGEALVRYFVDAALQKHETVHIRMEEGNHDPDATKWFRAIVRALYRDNPRVVTHDSAENFYGIRFGNTLHISHHGHKLKPDNVMVTIMEKYRSILSDIDFIYVHSGHWHHNNVNTKGIVRMETYPTFAPNDDYASSGGWNAVKSALAITYDGKSGGETDRSTATILKRRDPKDIPTIEMID